MDSFQTFFLFVSIKLKKKGKHCKEDITTVQSNDKKIYSSSYIYLTEQNSEIEREKNLH